ncbi:MAG: flagellar biosynthesis repressor FlbT [Tardiphaga sp.]|nr:flagellar biosynthesis repressor FlbT [Tardiphaga sp.]
MTLRISLKDGEMMIVNGAAVRSIGRTRLCIEGKAAVLRGRDLDTVDMTTPARRLYYATIASYTDPEHLGAHQDEIVAALTEVIATLRTPVAQSAAASFARLVATSDYYRALADCRALMAMENASAPRARLSAATAASAPARA